jgi:hypothetical protein
MLQVPVINFFISLELERMESSSGKDGLRLKHAVANGDDSPVASDPVDPNRFDAISS